MPGQGLEPAKKVLFFSLLRRVIIKKVQRNHYRHTSIKLRIFLLQNQSWKNTRKVKNGLTLLPRDTILFNGISYTSSNVLQRSIEYNANSCIAVLNCMTLDLTIPLYSSYSISTELSMNSPMQLQNIW